jgi:HEAT repeat protein
VRLVRGRSSRVEKLKDKGDAKRLVRLLTYEKLTRQRDGRIVDRATETRKAAVEALGELDGDAAHDGLVRALRDPEHSVVSAAIRALQQRGHAEAAEPLTGAVTAWTDAAHERLREQALEALASFGRPHAARVVAARFLSRSTDLNEADGEVLRRLVDAGGETAARSTVGDLVTRLPERPVAARARTLLAWLAPDSVDPLIDLLDDPSAQREAALALGAIHDARATEPLSLLLLGSDDPSVRAAASWALGELRDPAAVGALLRASRDDDYKVRTESIAAFDKLGNVAVAVAMSLQLRTALEEGAQHAPLPAETNAGQNSSPPPAAPPVRQLPPRPSRPPLARRARPLLRRLLGEPPG